MDEVAIRDAQSLTRDVAEGQNIQGWENLPEPVLQNIFMHLDTGRQVIEAGFVCSQWRAAVMSSDSLKAARAMTMINKIGITIPQTSPHKPYAPNSFDKMLEKESRKGGLLLEHELEKWGHHTIEVLRSRAQDINEFLEEGTGITPTEEVCIYLAQRGFWSLAMKFAKSTAKTFEANATLRMPLAKALLSAGKVTLCKIHFPTCFEQANSEAAKRQTDVDTMFKEFERVCAVEPLPAQKQLERFKESPFLYAKAQALLIESYQAHQELPISRPFAEEELSELFKHLKDEDSEITTTILLPLLRKLAKEEFLIHFVSTHLKSVTIALQHQTGPCPYPCSNALIEMTLLYGLPDIAFQVLRSSTDKKLKQYALFYVRHLCENNYVDRAFKFAFAQTDLAFKIHCLLVCALHVSDSDKAKSTNIKIIKLLKKYIGSLEYTEFTPLRRMIPKIIQSFHKHEQDELIDEFLSYFEKAKLAPPYKGQIKLQIACALDTISSPKAPDYYKAAEPELKYHAELKIEEVEEVVNKWFVDIIETELEDGSVTSAWNVLKLFRKYRPNQTFDDKKTGLARVIFKTAQKMY